MSRKVLRTDLILESCGESCPSYTASDKHSNGCYIRFSDNRISHTKPRTDCIVDYDDKGNIVGIEFYEGL